jgi:hypothetical protein
MQTQQQSTPGQQFPPNKTRWYKRIFQITLGLAGGSIITYIVNAALNGILGNFASDIFKSFITWLSLNITINILLGIATSIAVLTVIAIYWFMQHRNKHLTTEWYNARNELTQAQQTFQATQDELAQSQQTLQATQDDLVQLQQTLQIIQSNLETAKTLLAEKDQDLRFDDFLLDNMDGFKLSSPYDTNKIQKLLPRTLHKAIEAPIFNGNVHRASIFLPDDDGQHLRMCAHWQMPEDSVLRTVAYIGEDKNKEGERGAVGSVYREQELKVVHFDHENDTKSKDCPAYINFARERTTRPYRSFILVPILEITADSLPGNKKHCYGVLCLDSTNPSIFDSSAAQSLLLFVSKRLTAVLQVHHHLLQSSSTPVSS